MTPGAVRPVPWPATRDGRPPVRFLVLAVVAAAIIASCAAPPLSPRESPLGTLQGEGQPPGYISGNIPPEYQGLRDPFTLSDRQALEAGRGIYEVHCADCHGSQGRGDGPKAPYLEPRPADFAAPPMLAAFREHQDYVYWWVSEGVVQTSMPAYKDRLSETERWQVITYSWSLGERAGGTTPGSPGP